jgi:hypothetical protein
VTRFRPAAVAAALLVLHGCDDRTVPPPGHPPVEGGWHGDREDVELLAGGRLVLRRGAARALGRWEWVERDRMLVAYEGSLASAVPGDYRAGVAGDTLSLCETDAPERCMRLARGAFPDAAVATATDSAPPRLAMAPRADQLPPEARMAEATGVLKQVHTLQRTYQAEHGAYAPNLYELRTVGYEEPTLRHFLAPRLLRADARLCIVLEPRTPDLWPMHVDESGTVRQGRECG